MLLSLFPRSLSLSLSLSLYIYIYKGGEKFTIEERIERDLGNITKIEKRKLITRSHTLAPNVFNMVLNDPGKT